MALELSVAPADEMIDIARQVRLTGAKPGAQVRLSTVSRRAGGSLWQASTDYVADATGMVDLTRDAPVSGSYDGVSPMGLIWSQVERSPATSAPVGEETVVPVTTTFTADAGGQRAEATMRQHLLASGVTRRVVSEGGISGVLYLPEGPGPHPAVMVMNGSGGGINEPRAALYAARGYIALALGYFRCEGRPYWINDTPLEYFRDALAWLRRETRPLHDFVAITGQSRGGELVMLLAATFPEAVSAVMAYVPASCVHSAQSAGDPARGRFAPTWTLDGKPLPHLWDGNRTGTYAPYDNGPEPRRHEYATLTAMADRAAVDRSRIPVENIRGRVLLVHGTDDGWWPTDYHCDVMEDALRGAGRQVERLRCVGAGHVIAFPYLPTTAIVAPHPVSGILSTHGGTPQADAAANEKVWPTVLDFLRRAVDAAGQNNG